MTSLCLFDSLYKIYFDIVIYKLALHNSPWARPEFGITKMDKARWDFSDRCMSLGVELGS